MHCPQCRRIAPPQRNRCLYCGADLQKNDAKGADVKLTKRDAAPYTNSHATILIEEKSDATAIEHLAGLPEPMRQKALEVLREKGQALKVDEPTVAQASVDSEAGYLRVPGTLEESLKVLKRIKGQFDTDRIDYDVYRQVVIETVKGYLESLDRKTRLTYMANDVKDSEVFSYLDEDMHRALLKYAVTTASETDKK